jgi:hypothetical protein
MKKLVAVVASTVVLLAVGELALPALAQESAYKLSVEATPAKKGQRAVAKLKITPGAGYHMNKEYPTSLVINEVPGGVTVDKMKFTMKDAARWEEAGGEFDVGVTSADTGKKVVKGELKFAVCSTNTCDPKKSPVSFEIDVK